MVVDDLRDSSHHDRTTGERRTHNQQEQWRRLYKYWAAYTGETLLVQIRWLGTDGAYECKLVERPEIEACFQVSGQNATLLPCRKKT